MIYINHYTYMYLHHTCIKMSPVNGVMGTKIIKRNDKMIGLSLNLKHKTNGTRQKHKRLKLRTQSVQDSSINIFLLQ
jgi:hypothetical protein